MLSTDLILVATISLSVVLILGKTIFKGKLNDRTYLYLFVFLNFLVLVYFAFNYLSAKALYSENVLEAPNEIVALVILEDLKIMLSYMFFNILYVLFILRKE